MICRSGGDTFAAHFCRDLAADLCCGWWDRRVWSPALLDGIAVRDLAVRSRLIGWRTFRRQHAFRKHNAFLSDYDTAVYSGCDSLAAACPGAGYNLHYCHTPPRHYYDQYRQLEADDLERLRVPRLGQPPLRLLRSALIDVLRRRYETAIQRMDRVVANSETVARRLRHYLGVDAAVVHPPCDTAAFAWRGQEDFYLSTARHEPLKRIDAIIAAFRRMPDRRLVVASVGSQTKTLRRQAAGAANICFVGCVDDAKLQDLIGLCTATIYVPVDEDFGISPVESMAAGKPVIGAREGGLLETMVDGETGLLIDMTRGADAIVDAVLTLDGRRAAGMREPCERRAPMFGRKVFRERMGALL
ncbi:MAG: glycosyltransferase [Salinisphaera sp.]|nr:glycosyltransferase [Salinisphaera sp.]